MIADVRDGMSHGSRFSVRARKWLIFLTFLREFLTF